MQFILGFGLVLVVYTSAHTIYRIPDRSDEKDTSRTRTKYADYLDSEYEEVMEEPNPDCKFIGDIIRNPADQCSYLECHYGTEPRYDRGRLLLYTFSRHCPPGSAVKEDEDDEDVLFRPIQHDPTKRVSRYDGSPDIYKTVGGSRFTPRYKFKNTYFDKTAICSERVDTAVCKDY